MTGRFDCDDLCGAVERMEAEAGCELPDLSDPTLADRARRLLACDDPPRGEDAEMCRTILAGG